MFGRRGKLPLEVYAPYTPEPLEPDSPVYQPRGGSNSLGLEGRKVSSPYASFVGMQMALVVGILRYRWR